MYGSKIKNQDTNNHYDFSREHLNFEIIGQGEIVPLGSNPVPFMSVCRNYKVIRFELGTDEELWRIVCYQIDKALAAWGVDYSISNDKKSDMYADKLRLMMVQFEANLFFAANFQRFLKKNAHSPSFFQIFL